MSGRELMNRIRDSNELTVNFLLFYGFSFYRVWNLKMASANVTNQRTLL